MDQRDDDIEFDFFEDEAATGETQSRVRLPRRGTSGNGGGRRSLGPPRGSAPVLRLLGLVVIAVFLVLVFGLLIQSCASKSKHDAYESYMADVQKIAAQSTANGKALATALTTPSLTAQQIETKIRGVADQERQNVRNAQGLDAPGRLRDENGHLVDTLVLRVSGYDGLADAFKSTAGSDSPQNAALLAAQANRLLASDIVWDDLFRAPALAQLATDDVTGVSVPDSSAVADTDLITEKSMELLLARIGGASTGGDRSGLHGTNIIAVRAQPGDQQLTPGQLNTVTATTELAFDVVVEDSGDSQEVGIPVTLTIEQGSGKPIVKTDKIDLINPGEQVTVTFNDLGDVRFATQTTVKVDVAPVEGEENKDNNSAQYSVIFSLP
jgi:hypothetical protein